MPTPARKRGALSAPRLGSSGPSKEFRIIASVMLTAASLLLVFLPVYVDAYSLRVFSMIFMYASLAQGINLIAGFAGYPAFGNVVFFGVGAYCVAIVMKVGGGFPEGMVLALLVSISAALLLGPALLRLRGHYFAIATVGLNETVKALVNNLTSLTGGGMGLSLPLPPWPPLETAQFFYYLLLTTMIVSVLIAAWLKVSRLGYAARAIRDDEVKAEAMGIRTTTIKTIIWALSGALTASVGGVYAFWFSYVEPPAVFDMLIAIKAFVIFLFGGAATVLGPVLSAFVIEYASTVIWSRLLDYHLGALGLMIMLIAIYMPDGLWRFLRNTYAGLRSPAEE